MKKLIVFSICLSLIICSLVLVSCKEAPDEPLEYDMPEYSLSSLTGTTGNSITLSFSEEATLNVLELIEEVTPYKVLVWNTNRTEHMYIFTLRILWENSDIAPFLKYQLLR